MKWQLKFFYYLPGNEREKLKSIIVHLICRFEVWEQLLDALCDFHWNGKKNLMLNLLNFLWQRYLSYYLRGRRSKSSRSRLDVSNEWRILKFFCHADFLQTEEWHKNENDIAEFTLITEDNEEISDKKFIWFPSFLINFVICIQK
jgi:hypothetical protein